MVSSEFDSFCSEQELKIEAALGRYLTLDDAPPRLVEAMRYSALEGGKRFRPLLALMAAQACGGVNDDALAAGCAVELVHVFSLIHDDLPAMDDDDLRRGKPSNHKQFGEAEAILAGDALLAQAFSVLSTEVPSPELSRECMRLLAKATGALGMCGGQSLDMTAKADLVTDLENMHRCKTGALIRAALLMGAHAAVADASQLKALSDYGAQVGLLYQIVDDVLDAESTGETLGKTSGKDAVQGKKTFVTLLGLKEAKVQADKRAAAAIETLGEFGVEADLLREFVECVRERQS